MFKLLTEAERQKVTHEYAIRRMIIILCALILVFVVGVIGFLPSYALSNARQNEAFERTSIISVKENEEASELKLWLKEINQKLQVLSPKLDTDRPSDFVEKVLNQRITGVTITGFSWIRAKDKITLSINGVALDRQTLISFENSINSSGYFSEATLPISNLAKDKNIDFQIKFSPL